MNGSQLASFPSHSQHFNVTCYIEKQGTSSYRLTHSILFQHKVCLLEKMSSFREDLYACTLFYAAGYLYVRVFFICTVATGCTHSGPYC